MTLYKRILIRCDGSSRVGMGHVIRCLALADELRRAYGCKVAFALREGASGIALIEDKKYPFCYSNEQMSSNEYSDWILGIVEDFQPHVFIMDIRDDLPVSTVQEIKDKEVLIVTIDDPSDRRLVADLAFYPPVPQVSRMNWEGFSGELHVGWEWILLRPQFATTQSKYESRQNGIQENSLNVLVTMGGSDPQGLTLMALQALEHVENDLFVTVIIGNAFLHQKDLNRFLHQSRWPCIIKHNVTDMAAVMAEADFAIASFGVTAYELAAMGVPSIFLCLTDDHAESASAFELNGLAINLGNYVTVCVEKLLAAISWLIQDKSLRNSMHKKSELVDGKGINRIACLINNHLEGSYASN